MLPLEVNMPQAEPDTTDWKVPCEVYSRVVGFLRPVESWNIGKRQEFEDRVVFKMPEIPKKE